MSQQLKQSLTAMYVAFMSLAFLPATALAQGGFKVTEKCDLSDQAKGPLSNGLGQLLGVGPGVGAAIGIVSALVALGLSMTDKVGRPLKAIGIVIAVLLFLPSIPNIVLAFSNTKCW